MRKVWKLYIVTGALFALLFIISDISFSRILKENEDRSNILMNRVYNEIGAGFSSSDEGSDAAELAKTLIDEYFYSREEELKKEFGAESTPDRVYFIDALSAGSEVMLLNPGRDQEKIWTVERNGSVCGFIVFEYGESGYHRIRLILNLTVLAAFIIAMAVCTYIGIRILGPFGKLVTYPEKLSKNQLTEKLPETKNRFFGRFTWGINMLSDRLASDRRRIGELSREHLTMLTTIAHGIKTPVSNIKLYADAISTGLYQPDGSVNKSDAEVAARISKNADDIAAIVGELIDKAQGGVVDFTPVMESFYLTELADHLKEEYSGRLDVLRIPYSFEVESNALIKSDKSGICRILSQLMENAIKYGNGEGIRVLIRKADDGYLISFRNKGQVLEKKELPYIFNSFYRGSNSEGIPGSGIGLFECYEITRRLNGDIYARCDAENSEMEFEVYLPAASAY